MPIYEYRCAACGNEFEVTQRITAEPGADCPECGGEECKRLISTTSFTLKGSGWYVTDYGGKGPNGGAPGPSSAKRASEDSGGGTDKSSDKGSDKGSSSSDKGSSSSDKGSSSSDSSSSTKSSSD